MSALETRLQDDVTVAMKAGDKIRVGTLRQIGSQLQYEKMDAGASWSEQSAQAVLMKAAKMRLESIDQFEAGGRNDLVEKERVELRIIEEYLPDQMSDDELDALVAAAVQKTGATGPQDMGKVMGIVMPDAKGRADGANVSARVRRKLADG